MIDESGKTIMCPNCSAKQFDIVDRVRGVCRCSYCDTEIVIRSIGLQYDSKEKTTGDYVFHCVRIAIYVIIEFLFGIGGFAWGMSLLNKTKLGSVVLMMGGLLSALFLPDAVFKKMEQYLYSTAPKRRYKRLVKRIERSGKIQH